MSYIIKPRKNTAWRKHVLNSLVADTIIHEKIETSLPIAKSLTKLLAKLITWAKKDTLHSRRLALRYLISKKKSGVVTKLFTDLKTKYEKRPGGYSRIVKLGLRNGDNNLRVILALV